MAKHESKMNKAISVVLGIIAAVLMAAAVLLAIKHYWPEKQNYSNFKNKNNISSVPELLPINPIDFPSLKAQNGDVCGWIKFDCLDIDYPIDFEIAEFMMKKKLGIN